MHFPEVIPQRAAAESIRRGHPWIYRGGIMKVPPMLPSGTVVAVRGAGGEPLGHGVYDAESPIAVRMWTTGTTTLSADLLRTRLETAFASRRALFANRETTAYRLLNGEGDRAPGYVVDRYGPIAILRIDGQAAIVRRPEITPALWAALRPMGIESLVHRMAERGQPPTFKVLEGAPPPPTLQVYENGVPWLVDLSKGQKTGAFLDQRENRLRVRGFAAGKRVLNLFSYAGGFSVQAALGSSGPVTSVDTAAHAHATAQANFKLAGIDSRDHAFVTADAFAFLDDANRKGLTWDLIISDPPSFAPSEKAVRKAITAYRMLHRACARVLAPGGIFCAASCSSHIDAMGFLGTLDDASLERADLRLLELHGPPADHPIVPAWKEGLYLKFAVLS